MKKTISFVLASFVFFACTANEKSVSDSMPLDTVYSAGSVKSDDGTRVCTALPQNETFDCVSDLDKTDPNHVLIRLKDGRWHPYRSDPDLARPK